MFQDQRVVRQYLSVGLDHKGVEEVKKIITLGNRGVKILVKCSRKQKEVVATQTTLKDGIRPGKHFSYRRQLVKRQQSDNPHKL